MFFWEALSGEQVGAATNKTISALYVHRMFIMHSIFFAQTQHADKFLFYSFLYFYAHVQPVHELSVVSL